MKSYNFKDEEYMETPTKIIQFFDEVVNLCKKYNLIISHEDGHGEFKIVPYKKLYMEWTRDASIYGDKPWKGEEE